MQHFHLFPPSMKVTNGLMYARHRLHLAITLSSTTGTGSSPSLSLYDRYGAMTSARGSFDLLSRD
jgi:hypothetical protein